MRETANSGAVRNRAQGSRRAQKPPKRSQPKAMNEALPPRGAAPSFRIDHPTGPRAPLIFASPHSGRDYPKDFLAASGLSFLELRRSEDSFVEQLFGAAPGWGATLLQALFPRAYVDPNREPFELDPAMFEVPLPHYANSRSARVAAGLGTIPRIVASGAEIYRGPLELSEAIGRIRTHYWPYHAALRGLIDAALSEAGVCYLIDCHSMPSRQNSESPNWSREKDFVLGDAFASSCGEALIARVEGFLIAKGYRVVRNTPYSGGFVTRHYGQPASGVHALQIEINRRLYMHEDSFTPHGGFGQLQAVLGELIADLVDFAPRTLQAAE